MTCTTAVIKATSSFLHIFETSFLDEFLWPILAFQIEPIQTTKIFLVFLTFAALFQCHPFHGFHPGLKRLGVAMHVFLCWVLRANRFLNRRMTVVQHGLYLNLTPTNKKRDSVYVVIDYGYLSVVRRFTTRVGPIQSFIKTVGYENQRHISKYFSKSFSFLCDSSHFQSTLKIFRALDEA